MVAREKKIRRGGGRSDTPWVLGKRGSGNKMDGGSLPKRDHKIGCLKSGSENRERRVGGKPALGKDLKK